MANRCGNNRNSDRLYILRLQKYCRWWLQPWNYKTLAPWKKNYDKSRQHTKKQSHYFANKYPSSQSYGFPIVTYGYESWTIKRASPKELMLLNCYGVGKDSWESLGLQGNPTSPSWRKSVLTIHWKDWSWSSNTLAAWSKELTHLKRPWCWERSRAGGEGDDRRWDGLMASPTQWTGVWVDSVS